MDPPGRTRDRDRAITCTYVPGTSRYARSEAPGRSQPASGKTKRETWTSRTDLIIPRTPHRHRRDRAGARRSARARSPAFPLVFYHVFWPFAFPHEAYPREQESGPPAPRAPRASPDTPSPTRRAALAVTCRAAAGGVWSASPLGTPWSARRGLTGVAQAVFHIVYLPVLTPILRFYGASPYACCTLDVRVPCAPPLLEPLCDCDCDCCCCCWSQSSAA